MITMEHTKLTVLYDERCAFCRRSADWLATQPVLAEMEVLGAGTPEARRRCSDVTVGGKELVVVDERGPGMDWAGRLRDVSVGYREIPLIGL